MNAKYVETSDPEIIRKQLEHAEKCGVRWSTGEKPLEGKPAVVKNIGYNPVHKWIAQSHIKTYSEALSFEEWCEWLTEITEGWKIIHPYDFKLPENPEACEWQFWNGSEWEIFCTYPNGKGNKYTYRYRPLPKKSRLSELAETLGVDEELLREALKEVSK